jgi:DNA-binding transcriptional LysR family regulator
MDWVDRIGRRIRLRDLHVLLAVAETGSMSKASARLAVSHPVVSKTILQLEQSLGVQLFERNTRGVELTRSGAVLLNCGVAVFDEMRQSLKQLQAIADPAAGELRIGCPEITMAGLLPAIVERFSKQYPRVRLHVELLQAMRLQFQELRERKIDLLIGRIQQTTADDLKSEMLFAEPFLVVAGNNSKWARRKGLKLADLLPEPWALPPYDSVPGQLIQQIFQAANLQLPEPTIVTLSGQLTVTLVAGGGFVGILPASVAKFNTKRAGLKILPIKLPTVHVAASIVTVKNRTPSPTARLFINCVRDVARLTSAQPEPGKSH